MVRGPRLVGWAVAALAILSAAPAFPQQPPGPERYSLLLFPIASPDPTLRPLAARLFDAVQTSLRAQATPGVTVLVFRRDDPSVERALREHSYIELPADEQVSPALADALGWVLRADTTLSGTLEAQDATARLALRASGVRSRVADRQEAQAPLGREVREGAADAVARWADQLVGPAVAALAPRLAALAAAAPADPGAHFREGERLFAQGDYAQAIIEYDMASAANPEEPAYYIALSRAYRALGDSRTALLEARRALRLQPDSTQAQVLLGDIYADLGRLERALHALQAAALADPRSREALRGLARVYEAQGQDQMALAQYERLLRLAPESPDALLAAGALAERLGRWSEAAAYYHQAVALLPDRADLRQRLIDLHRRQGDPAAAVAALKQAQDAGVEMRYDPPQFLSIGRITEAEAADVIAAAQAQAKAHREGPPGRRPPLDVFRALRERSEVLALATEALAAPEPLGPAHRHRVLAFHQLNQSNYELLRYVETRLREHYTRSLLLRDAAQKELAKTRELEADAGWPAVTPSETDSAAEPPAL